eukprot:scaffold152073_cov25-Prasinocladus_malaysianus.AAC.1
MQKPCQNAMTRWQSVNLLVVSLETGRRGYAAKQGLIAPQEALKIIHAARSNVISAKSNWPHSVGRPPVAAPGTAASRPEGAGRPGRPGRPGGLVRPA